MLGTPMTLDATATTIPSPISSNIPEPRPGRLASEQSNTPQSTHNKQIGQPYCAESGLRATIKDFAKARGQRPQNRGNACAPASHAAMKRKGAWSSGRIRASGARGRGFDSRSSPSHTPQCCASSRAVAGRAHPQRRPSNKCGKASALLAKASEQHSNALQ